MTQQVQRPLTQREAAGLYGVHHRVDIQVKKRIMAHHYQVMRFYGYV